MIFYCLEQLLIVALRLQSGSFCSSKVLSGGEKCPIFPRITEMVENTGEKRTELGRLSQSQHTHLLFLQNTLGTL